MKVKILHRKGHKVINLNRRRAIRERCLNCSEWSHKEVTNCVHRDCQLYPFRSGAGKQDAKSREKAIRAYCLWCCAGQSGEVSKCPALDCPLFAYRMTKVDRSVEVLDAPVKMQAVAGL